MRVVTPACTMTRLMSPVWTVPPALAVADLPERVADAVAAIRAETTLVPAVALPLGSGLGPVVDDVRAEATAPPDRTECRRRAGRRRGR